jgi:mRNA interferase MazF
MPSTTSFKVGDIVSVQFPYSDLQGSKRRPGLVLHVDEKDVLLARITTRPPTVATDVSLAHWTESSLPRASTVRLTKLASIDQGLIHRPVGRLHPADAKAVLQALQTWLQNLATNISS